MCTRKGLYQLYTALIVDTGVLDIGFRLGTSIDGALNVAGAFTGEVANRENIGKSSADWSSYGTPLTQLA